MVIFGVLSSNSFDITAMQMYIDPASVVITFWRINLQYTRVFQTCRWNQRIQINSLPFKDKTYDPSQTIRTIIDMSMSEEKKVCLHLKKLQTELKTNS